jgi:hypothetical protein
LLDERCQEAIEVSEQFADDVATRKELEAAQSEAWKSADQLTEIPTGHLLGVGPDERALRANAWATRAVIEVTSPDTPMLAIEAVRKAATELTIYCQEWAIETASDRILVSLVHEIFGNPFRPYAAPMHCPATVTQLAESLYTGEECAFALHDALLEAGHVELAEHFREEQWHPKGCWALDLVLGKQ